MKQVLGDVSIQGQLSDEQKFMAEKIKDNAHGVIHMGTGRGKSWVIYNTVCEKKCRTAILCHNIQTADDMYEGFKAHTNIPAEKIGLVHSKSKHPATYCVDIMTHASFVKNYREYIGKYDCILYDECDYNLSFPQRNDYDCMIGALIALAPACLYGFTGTPYRADGGVEVLNRVFGDVWTYEQQEYYNYIPKVTQVFYTYKGDWDFEHWSDVMHNLQESEHRIQSQVSFINKYKRKWNMVLVKGVEESNVLGKLIPEAVVLNGGLSKTDKDYNLSLIDKFIHDNKGFMIIGTIDMVGRGVDIPPTDTLFLCSPVKFRGTVVQAVGRALRKYPGKTDALLYDWCDMPILKKQQVERNKQYQTEYNINKKDIAILNLQ